MEPVQSVPSSGSRNKCIQWLNSANGCKIWATAGWWEGHVWEYTGNSRFGILLMWNKEYSCKSREKNLKPNRENQNQLKIPTWETRGIPFLLSFYNTHNSYKHQIKWISLPLYSFSSITLFQLPFLRQSLHHTKLYECNKLQVVPSNLFLILSS